MLNRNQQPNVSFFSLGKKLHAQIQFTNLNYTKINNQDDIETIIEDKINFTFLEIK
jgi:hypothetical protein